MPEPTHAQIIPMPGREADDSARGERHEPASGVHPDPPEAAASEVVPHVAEAELLPEGHPGPRPVDVPETADKADFLQARRERLAAAAPLLPAWITDSGQRGEALKVLASYYAHLAAWHATRSPLYLLRLMGRAPRGTGRIFRAWRDWAFGLDALPDIGPEGKTPEYMAVKRRERAKRGPARAFSLLVAAAGTAGIVYAALVLPTGWITAGAAGVLCLLGAVGSRGVDTPITTRFTGYIGGGVKKLSSDEVEEAMAAVGVAGGKKGSITFAEPIAVDGPGWRAEIDLPAGATAADVMDRREKLAAAMRRPVATVWPSAAPEIHPGRLVLWVARQDPAKAPRRIWPLMHEGQADVFKPLPLGFDPRGNQVDVTLMYSNLVVGGIPGSGKTSAALAMALGVALDPTAQMWVCELKGSGDLGSVQPVCHRYISGDDDEDIEATVEVLRNANAEQKRRKKFIQSLPVREVPEGRRTSRELAERYPDKDLGPMVVFIDEAQELFTHEEYGDEAEVLCRRLIKKGRAYGVILVLLTQDPDASSLPPSVSRNAGTRFCLAVMDWRANNNVLGTGAYARGLRATDISGAEVGTGILAKQRDHWTLRAAFIKQTEADEIGKRALALRTAAGTLTGEAAGDDVATADASTVIDHLHAVWPEGAEAVHSHRLVEALAAYRPEDYGPWLHTDHGEEEAMTPERQREVRTERSKTLAAALRPHRVTTRQLTIRECCGGAKGLRYADLPAPEGGEEDED